MRRHGAGPRGAQRRASPSQLPSPGAGQTDTHRRVDGEHGGEHAGQRAAPARGCEDSEVFRRRQLGSSQHERFLVSGLMALQWGRHCGHCPVGRWSVSTAGGRHSQPAPRPAGGPLGSPGHSQPEPSHLCKGGHCDDEMRGEGLSLEPSTVRSVDRNARASWPGQAAASAHTSRPCCPHPTAPSASAQSGCLSACFPRWLRCSSGV